MPSSGGITSGYILVVFRTDKTPELAAVAYRKAALKYHGKFSRKDELIVIDKKKTARLLA
jgi:hypothetical protein